MQDTSNEYDSTQPEKPTPSTPQQPLPPLNISLKYLFSDRHRFKVDPAFQRQNVWPIRMAQALIDTILIGDPVYPPEAFEEYDEKGESTYIITDGHQRIKAILDFMDKVYKTWTPGQKRQSEPNSDLPVEPGKFFDELTGIARNHFLRYNLQINLIRKISDERITTRFLRVQNHIPLSAAEKLNAYKSKAKDTARRIEQHAFWEDFYVGRTNREQLFQCSLQLLAIELSKPGGIVELHTNAFFHGLAMGKRDKDITDTTIDDVLSRLDLMAHVFQGMHPFSLRAAIIPMYQSIMFLEQAGYTIQKKDKGRLATWMDGLIDSSTRATGVPSWVQPIQKLTRENAQKAFWNTQYGTVMRLFGINKPAA